MMGWRLAELIDWPLPFKGADATPHSHCVTGGAARWVPGARDRGYKITELFRDKVSVQLVSLS